MIAVATATYYLINRAKKSLISVKQDIDIKEIEEKVTKANLHSLYLMASQKLPSIVGTVDSKGKLTLYSLYKQINEGDADDVPENEQLTDAIKYQAWL
jgi:acyl-CoA-binding protein